MLVLWAPFIKDSSNQGLNIVTNLPELKDTLISSGGKLGNKASHITQKYKINFISDDIKNIISFCGWFNFTKTGDEIISFSDNHSLKIDSSNTILFDSISTGIKINKNEYNHIAIIFDNELINIYVNGEHKIDKIMLNAFQYNNEFSIGSAGIDFLVNDLRFYNHALSLKEIKELSKGLFLSYRLSGPAPQYQPVKSDPKFHNLGYDNPIEYDTSGYKRNGLIFGEKKWDIDSARYATSYNFPLGGNGNGSRLNIDTLVAFTLYTTNSQNYIELVDEDLTSIKSGTISFWAKIDINHFQGEWTPFSTKDKTKFLLQLNNLNNTYFRHSGVNNNIKIYIDGVLLSTSYSLDNKWHFYTATNVDLSGWEDFKIHNCITPANYNDFRIYTTSFATDDILELYHSAVIVDNTGKNYAYEYFEAN